MSPPMPRRLAAMNALRGLALLRGALQREADVDAPDHQRLAVQLHLAFGVRDQLPGGCWDLARLQRASVGPGQSTRRGSHQVVEGRRVRLVGAGPGARADEADSDDVRVGGGFSSCGSMTATVRVGSITDALRVGVR